MRTGLTALLRMQPLPARLRSARRAGPAETVSQVRLSIKRTRQCSELGKEVQMKLDMGDAGSGSEGMGSRREDPPDTVHK